MPEPSQDHIPVLATAVVEHLGGGLPGPLADCTLGLGGHALLLLERDPSLQIIGLDVDEANLALAEQRLADYRDRVKLVRANFADLRGVLSDLGVGRLGGILADLGLSSNQIADPDRGFSFDVDGPLDMRMDRRQETTAADLVNTLPEGELADLLYLQSQERSSRRIAKRVCQSRRQGRLNSTAMLARLVASALGGDPRRSRIHPATRTFMALRMSVNRETASLRRLLDQAPDCLEVGGRVAVISFHSVEDRIVKVDFRRRLGEGRYEVLTNKKKPIVAGQDERASNPRSRSAKLRVARLRMGT